MGPCSSSSKSKQASPIFNKETKEIPSSQANPQENQPKNKLERNNNCPPNHKEKLPNEVKKPPPEQPENIKDEDIKEREEEDNTENLKRPYKKEKLGMD